MGEELAASLLSPDGDWRLMEETVFQFNAQYRRFWAACDDNSGSANTSDHDHFFAPVLFDKATRTFNWVAIAGPRLGADYPKDELESRIDIVDGSINVLKRFFGTGDSFDHGKYNAFASRYSDSKRYEKSVRIVRFILQNNIESYDRYELWHAVCTLYSSYPHPLNHNIEGIFYEIFRNTGRSNPDILVNPIFGTFKDSDLSASNLDVTKRPTEFVEWKLLNSVTDGIGIRDSYASYGNVLSEQDQYDQLREGELNATVSAFLGPLFLEWQITINNKRGSLGDLLKDKDVFTGVFFIPLFDVWIGTNGYGAINGVIVVSHSEGYGDPIAREPWNTRYAKLLARSEQFSREITSTLIRRAIANPIEPPYDLVRHFLRILVEMQDWEEAVVFYDGMPQYQYSRELAQGKVRSDWLPKDIGYEKAKNNKPPKPKLDGPLDQCGAMEEDDNLHFYMWWTCGPQHVRKPKCERPVTNLWSRHFLPDMTDAERAAFEGTAIRFKFPKACRIPKDTASRDFMVQTYLRQQLELMRVLIPKVRARRAALGNAVSAIMGRNLSHNIGSHVLARYSTKIGQHINGLAYDPRSDFLYYLQRRMDFLAEIGTSDRSYWAQPLLLKQQLGRLNYGEQMGIYYGEIADVPNSDRYVPLLQFISGKDGLISSVSFKNGERLLFSCPGGEVGLHALFVILENIIRNSARHNGLQKDDERLQEYNGRAELCVEAHSSVDREAADDTFSPSDWKCLIQLRIIDPHTKLRSDGTKTDSNEPIGDRWQWQAKLELEKDSITGKHLPFKALPDVINYILQYEPIIGDDGGPNPHFWGLREMQICAQYLRQLNLSDLEDVPYADHDSAAGRIPLLRAECIEYGKDEDGTPRYCLAYVLYLLEPRLLLLIDGNGSAQTSEFNIDNGVATLRLAINGHASRSHLSELSRFAFAAFDSTDDNAQKFVAAHTACLPMRVLALIPKEAGSASPAWSEVADRLKNSNDPIAAIEELHRLYADKLARAKTGGQRDSSAIAALALHNDGLEAAFHTLGSQPGRAIIPIQVLRPDQYVTRQYNQASRLSVLGATSQYIVPGIYEEYFGLIERPSFLLFFADHYKEYVGWMISRIRQDCSPEALYCFIEPCYQGTPATEALNSLAHGQGWELVASGLQRVLVMDERVQSRAGDDYRGGIYQDRWRDMLVDVPDSNLCNLNSPKWTDCKAVLAREEGVRPHERYDVLVIHLTVLERLQAHCSRLSLSETIDKLVSNSRLADDAPIVIVTGRGVPTFARSALSMANEPPGSSQARLAGRLRYLPISALLEYLVSNPSKLGFMRVLWSASQPGADYG